MAMDIGQAVISPLKAVSQLFVVKPKQVHPGSLEIMDMDWIFGYTKA